ncbi:hypothetical protein GP486_000216 [Trichoglossum hirsutum]|uniref:ELYS-like domain-containing protein n=1 Tax=Trichoglossum hirsutum TaxID=265104 RepID=A0A9P8LJF8_9PEZI|nr:hypothetical protein GP486_000216 [Trichoglossum hirsutum]
MLTRTEQDDIMCQCDITVFEEVFPFESDYNPYDGEIVGKIIRCRGQLEKELFFDKLLGLLNIARDLYPPTSIEGLRNLHGKIVASNAAEHHKQSLIFYLLQDCLEYPQVAAEFADNCLMPANFVIYMKGLWLMDQIQFGRALEYLSHPSLGTPTFADEILFHLVRRDKSDFTVPLAYYHTVNPPLTNRNALDAFFDCLCWVSTSEAFFFSRTQPETIRRYLFEQLIKFVLSGMPATHLLRRKELAEDERANKAIELINLPLTEDENQWFEDYLTEDNDSTLRNAKDTLLMRRIGTGKFREALKDKDGLSHSKLGGINWEALWPGIEKGLGPRNALEDILPVGSSEKS